MALSRRTFGKRHMRLPCVFHCDLSEDAGGTGHLTPRQPLTGRLAPGDSARRPGGREPAGGGECGAA